MRRSLSLTLLAATALASNGCTSLGGTVKGDFTCRAPAGTCAPMTTIDAAAIRGVDAEPSTIESDAPLLHGLTGKVGSLAVRTGERMLTILLPAHVDEAGVLHDAATVHAVVEPAGWTFTAAPSAIGTSPEYRFSRSPAPSSLREAVAGASAPAIEGLESLPAQAPHMIPTDIGQQAPPPDLMAPSAAALAAARAGHRIGSDRSSGKGPIGQGAGIAPGHSVANLPAGKVVLPQGDAAPALDRLQALAAPGLTRLETVPAIPTLVPEDVSASPFGPPASAEQPR